MPKISANFFRPDFYNNTKDLYRAEALFGIRSYGLL